MTEQDKQALIAELRKEIQEDVAIYIGMNVLKGVARLIGAGALALGYYLITHGYIKL